MSKFTQYDFVTIADKYVDITQGRAYEVKQAMTSGVIIIDDAGDRHGIPDADCTLVPTNQVATGVATGNPFKKGDTVECIHNNAYITVGNIYTVTIQPSKGSSYVGIVDDDGDDNSYPYTHFQQAIGASVMPVRSTTAPKTFAAQYGDDSKDDGMSYDERKAARSVMSKGRWQVGQVLVYADGTPTLTTLTVKFCTASCVCFEETYSQPFSPDEFTRG